MVACLDLVVAECFIIWRSCAQVKLPASVELGFPNRCALASGTSLQQVADHASMWR